MSTPQVDFRLPFDEPIYRAINGIGSPVLDAAFAAASSTTFGTAMVVVMAVFIVLSLKRAAIPALLQLGLVIAATDRIGHALLKPFVNRMRPCFALNSVRQLVDVAHSGSMPSLHSANSFAVATTVALLVPRAGWVVYPVAAFIALSRVGVGVHWPSDIIAGALFGSLIGAAVVLLVRRFYPSARPQR